MLETHFRGGYMLNLSELMYSYSNKIGSNIKKTDEPTIYRD